MKGWLKHESNSALARWTSILQKWGNTIQIEVLSMKQKLELCHPVPRNTYTHPKESVTGIKEKEEGREVWENKGNQCKTYD